MKLVHFDKRIDKYKQLECVICMEEFEKDSAVRIIPICKHIFHSKCLDHWIKSRDMRQDARCPMCNTTLTISTLEAAINKDKEERMKKKHKKT